MVRTVSAKTLGWEHVWGVEGTASFIMASVEERRERVVDDIKELMNSKLGQALCTW